MRSRSVLGVATIAVAAVSVRAHAQPAIPPATAAALTVSLDDAVRLALAASPDLVRDTGAVRTARAGERSARAAYLPTLSLESNLLRSTTPSPLSQPGALSSTSNHSAGAGLAANLDLFTGGRRGADARRAGAVSDASEAGLVARRYAVALDAQRAVFDQLRARDLVRVQQARVARAEQGVSYARHRHDAGVATRSDELRARLELSQAKQELAATEGTFRTSRYALGRVVGVDGPVDARAIDSLAPHPLDVPDSALVAMIVESAPVVRAAAADDRAADASVRAARARYSPTVQLGGAYRVIGQPEVTVPGAKDQVWALRLGLSYPLFDGLQREEAITRARVSSDVTTAALRDVRRSARVDAERALEALRVAETRIALAREGVDVATEDLRVVQVRYQNGAASILDLITSQTNVSSAESGLVDARFDYAVARAELSALAGRAL